MAVSKSDVISSNNYLSEAEKQINATYIAQYLLGYGWTLNAICGMLGNMEQESNINPGVWQDLEYGDLVDGYGLVQWTPATNLINWCNSMGLAHNDIDSQLKRILYELDNGVQFYPSWYSDMTFSEYVVSTLSPEELARIFVYNYERAGDVHMDNRTTAARKWFNYLNGNVSPEIPDTPDTPVTPDPPVTPDTYKGHKMSLLMMYQATRRR